MALDPLTAGIEVGGKIIDLLFKDAPAEKAAAQLKLLELQQNGDLAQIAVNTEEAKSENLFVAGWRPAVGWVCCIAFAYHLILQPLLSFLLINAGHKVDLPTFNIELLSNTLYGMLGFGALRTFEKTADKGYLPWQK
jgi:Holin of 3TMs, for gene-transfer release